MAHDFLRQGILINQHALGIPTRFKKLRAHIGNLDITKWANLGFDGWRMADRAQVYRRRNPLLNDHGIKTESWLAPNPKLHLLYSHCIGRIKLQKANT